jgi:hypothetical protein
VAPAFAVKSMNLVAVGTPSPGCLPTNPSLFTSNCTFVVQANLLNAQNGGTVSGVLDAAAQGFGGSQAKQVPFSITVPPGSPTATATVQVLFDIRPCSGSSIAVAVTQQPNSVASNQVHFGDC